MGVCVGGCMGVRVGVGVRLCVMERGDGERVLRNNVRRIHGPQPTRFSPCVPITPNACHHDPTHISTHPPPTTFRSWPGWNPPTALDAIDAGWISSLDTGRRWPACGPSSWRCPRRRRAGSAGPIGTGSCAHGRAWWSATPRRFRFRPSPRGTAGSPGTFFSSSATRSICQTDQRGPPRRTDERSRCRSRRGRRSTDPGPIV